MKHAHRPRHLTVAVTLSLAAVGCANNQDAVPTSGRVDVDQIVLRVPALPVATLDLDAGFVTDPAQRPVSTRPALAARLLVVRAIPAGARVRRGDVVAVLDHSALDAAVARARADRRLARTQIGVVDQSRTTLSGKQTQLLSTRQMVEGKLAQARHLRPTLVANLRKLKGLLATIPVTPQTEPQRAQVRRAIRQLTAALAKLDAGVRAARSGLNSMAEGLLTLADAQSTLSAVRRIAGAQLDAARAGVDLARWQRAQAKVRTDTDGIVVSAAQAGDVLAAGATVTVIRPDRPRTVTAWVSPSDAARVCRGSLATMSADWSDSVMGGRVLLVGTRAEYPPTRHSTDEVHLTRGVPIVMSGAKQLPSGAPIDVSISTCSQGSTP